jgi:hypothetical protein
MIIFGRILTAKRMVLRAQRDARILEYEEKELHHSGSMKGREEVLS